MVVLVAFVAFYVPAQFYWALNTSRALDAYFSIQYKVIIQPEGERQISTILDEVQDMPHEVEKLNRIAEWVTTNFTELFWERYLHRNIILQTLDPPINRYRYDPRQAKSGQSIQYLGKIHSLTILTGSVTINWVPVANWPICLQTYPIEQVLRHG
ncbi:MAG: hypothetical protein QMD46_09875 [Methanomicrobiales archaeon]|nr:hypothetical protein [Methanomicrobiales archaeon]